MSRNAFTLIELLIVVAIIGILAAIAVPNFMNARIRANAAKSFSEIKSLNNLNIIRKNDTNDWMVDGNDDGTGDPERCNIGNWGNAFWGLSCEAAGLACYSPNKDGRIYTQLTTPVNYMAGIPKDPFTKGVFYTYGTSHCPNSPLGAYWCFIAAGPDQDENDVSWTIGGGASRPYNPTNGLVSEGDIWMSYKLTNQSDRSYDVSFGQYQNSFF